MDYASKHADALYKLRDRGDGVAVSFVTRTSGYYDESTDVFVPGVDATTDGYAVEIPGDPEEYAALELRPQSHVMILFVPTTIGMLPPIGSTLQWAGELRTVIARIPIRPAEVALAAKIVLA